MNDAKAATRRMPWLGLALMIMAMPACKSAGPWSPDQAGASARVAYRPVQTSLRGRPFYVSGYGGADYSPSRPRRGVLADGVPVYVAPAPPASPPTVSIRQGNWDEP